MKTRNRLCSIVIALLLLPFICATASADTAQGIETQITASESDQGSTLIYGDSELKPPAIEGTQTQITTNNSSQSSPDIYGERIVWQDDRNGYYDAYVYEPNWDIYMYDLSSSTESQITTNESNQSEPAIYGDRIVWTDDRNGNYDVYMYNISAFTETQITTNESNQSEPAIYGDRIVWTDDRNGNVDIYMYDLSASTETQITTNESNQSGPAIYGDRIVWTDERNGNEEYIVDIYMYDLSTSTETQIAGGGGFLEYGPVIYGDRVVYTSEGAGDLVWMYDLSTSELTFIGYDAWGPDIYGDRIVWMFGMGHSDIYMYDLSTSREIQITSDETVHQGDPAIYGDRIVWMDGRNGNEDIYMFTLDSIAELTPLDRIKDLKNYVENDLACNPGTEKSLIKPLDKSIVFLENCQDGDAVLKLKSFINLVEKIEKSKRISADEAAYMVKEAKGVIDQIEMH